MRFYITYMNKNSLVGNATLDFLPRIGESIRIPNYTYKVKDIVYDIQYGQSDGIKVDVILE